MSIVPGRRHVSTADRKYTVSETYTTECRPAPHPLCILAVKSLCTLAVNEPCTLSRKLTALLNHTFSANDERARAVAWWAAGASVALAAGPILGGVLIAAIGWRSIFLINVPIGLLGIGLRANASKSLAGFEGDRLYPSQP